MYIQVHVELIWILLSHKTNLNLKRLKYELCCKYPLVNPNILWVKEVITMHVRKHFELNEKESTTYQNLCFKKKKAAPGGKFVVACVREHERLAHHTWKEAPLATPREKPTQPPGSSTAKNE